MRRRRTSTTPATPAASRASTAPGERDSRPIPFRAIADATYDWESWHSPQGELLWVNPAVERITGHGVAAVHAMRDYPLSLVEPEDRPRIEQVLQSACAGLPGNDVEFRVLRRDGATRWAAISWQSFGDESGLGLGFRTSVRDIHERKLAENRLQEALRLAEQAAASRQAFLANTSHELRTPLQGILGYAQLLAAAETDRAKTRKLDLIVQQTESLLAIVTNVLEMAALQVHAPEIVEEVFDLRAKLASIVDALRPQASEKAIELGLVVDERVPRALRGDRLRLRQVVTNLVANAIKFTEQGRVDVRATRGRGGMIRIVIEDTGIGIAPDELPHLFTPFARTQEAMRRGYSGTGLGLSIARALTEAMGGRLAVHSRPGHGSRFTVELPLAAVARPERRRDTPVRLDVLVVDDSPVGRELVREMLTGLGARVSTAASGDEAVRAVARAAPDLVLMDLQMPGLDGTTTAQLIRAQTAPTAPRPQIVALTANAFGRARALGPAGAMDGFLVKPVRLADLRALLERVAEDGESAESSAVLTGIRPPSGEALLDTAVVDDLARAKNQDGRSLLEVAGRRALDDTESCLRALRKALRTRHPERAAHLPHRMKGNCLMIGATSAARAAEALDEALARGGSDAIRATLRAFGREFKQLEGALAERVAQTNGRS